MQLIRETLMSMNQIFRLLYYNIRLIIIHTNNKNNNNNNNKKMSKTKRKRYKGF